MLAHLDAFGGQEVELRGQVPRLGPIVGRRAGVLEKGTHVPIAQVIGQNEEDIGFDRGGEPGQDQTRCQAEPQQGTGYLHRPQGRPSAPPAQVLGACAQAQGPSSTLPGTAPGPYRPPT